VAGFFALLHSAHYVSADASTASTTYPSVGAGKTWIVFSSGTTDSTQTVFHTPWIEDNFWTS
jgi:hypothetical protein